MKKILIIICIVPLLSSFNLQPAKPFSYSIIFGGCFTKDKVSVKVNNVTIVNNYEVTSNKMFRGISNLEISQIGSKIHITQNGKKVYKSASRLNEKIVFDFLVNSQSFHYEVNLKDGNIFLLEFCNAQNIRGQILTFEQRKTPIFIM